MLRHNMHGEEEDNGLHQPKRMEQAPAPSARQEEERFSAAGRDSGEGTQKIGCLKRVQDVGLA